MTMEIPVSGGRIALVDDEDHDRAVGAGKWSAIPRGRTVYAARKFGDLHVYLHTFLTGWDYIDHRNGNGMDNRKANLRQATAAENQWNSRRRSDNTSGYKGVSQRGTSSRWQAYIRAHGRQVSLGTYDTAEHAAYAYDAAARDLRGEFALLNFPERTAS